MTNPIDSESIFYVYVIFDHNAVPRYVGKGKGNRVVSTKRPTHRNYMKNAFIEETLSILGDIPLVKVRENLTAKQAFEIEIALVASIGCRKNGTGPLTNLTKGGDGLSSEDARQIAKSFTPERRLAINKAISAAHLKYSPEERSERAKKRERDRGEKSRKASGRKISATKFVNSTPEQRRASALIASKAVTKVFWINNGIKNRRTNHDDPVPCGWTTGRLMPQSIVDAIKVSTVNTRWINNGKTNRRLRPNERIPEGWNYGRSPKISCSIISHP